MCRMHVYVLIHRDICEALRFRCFVKRLELCHLDASAIDCIATLAGIG